MWWIGSTRLDSNWTELSWAEVGPKNIFRLSLFTLRSTEPDNEEKKKKKKRREESHKSNTLVKLILELLMWESSFWSSSGPAKSCCIWWLSFRSCRLDSTHSLIVVVQVTVVFGNGRRSSVFLLPYFPRSFQWRHKLSLVLLFGVFRNYSCWSRKNANKIHFPFPFSLFREYRHILEAEVPAQVKWPMLRELFSSWT